MESNKGKATTNFMGIPYMLAVDFSVETLQVSLETGSLIIRVLPCRMKIL